MTDSSGSNVSGSSGGRPRFKNSVTIKLCAMRLSQTLKFLEREGVSQNRLIQICQSFEQQLIEASKELPRTATSDRISILPSTSTEFVHPSVVQTTSASIGQPDLIVQPAASVQPVGQQASSIHPSTSVSQSAGLQPAVPHERIVEWISRCDHTNM